DEELRAQRVVGISDIDTRALTRHLRERGVMRGGVLSGPALLEHGYPRRVESLVQEVAGAPALAGADLAGEVSTREAYVVEASGPGAGHTVVAIDLGIKSMTPRRLAERGMRVHVLPADATITDIQALAPDGVFFSNGP